MNLFSKDNNGNAAWKNTGGSNNVVDAQTDAQINASVASQNTPSQIATKSEQVQNSSENEQKTGENGVNQPVNSLNTRVFESNQGNPPEYANNEKVDNSQTDSGLQPPAPDMVPNKITTRSSDSVSPDNFSSYLSGLVTSPAQEERERKAATQREAILGVGDMLRHYANLRGVADDAVPQKYTDPVTAEENKYQASKVARDTENQKGYNRAMQEIEWKRKADKDAADKDFKDKTLANQGKNTDINAARLKMLQEAQPDKIRKGKADADAAAVKGKNAQANEDDKHNLSLANKRAAEALARQRDAEAAKAARWRQTSGGKGKGSGNGGAYKLSIPSKYGQYTRDSAFTKEDLSACYNELVRLGGVSKKLQNEYRTALKKDEFDNGNSSLAEEKARAILTWATTHDTPYSKRFHDFLINNMGVSYKGLTPVNHTPHYHRVNKFTGKPITKTKPKTRTKRGGALSGFSIH